MSSADVQASIAERVARLRLDHPPAPPLPADALPDPRVPAYSVYLPLLKDAVLHFGPDTTVALVTVEVGRATDGTHVVATKVFGHDSAAAIAARSAARRLRKGMAVRIKANACCLRRYPSPNGEMVVMLRDVLDITPTHAEVPDHSEQQRTEGEA